MAYGGAFYPRHYWRQRVYRSPDTIAAGWGGFRWWSLGAYPYGAANRKWAAVAQLFLMHVIAAVTWVNFGVITRLHDDADFSGTPVDHFEAILRSTGGGLARARLFNITDGIPVSGSMVATISTTAIRVRSGALSMPIGEKEYRAQIGS